MYEKAYKYYTVKGYRVLTLAYKKLQVDLDFEEVLREDVEKDLVFCGFFICESPLKRDTKLQIDLLKDA